MVSCAKCNHTKHPDEFSRNRGHKSGRHTYCRACHAAYYAQKRDGQANATPSAGATPSDTPVVELANAGANTTESDQLYLLRYPWENSPIKIGHAKDVTARDHSLKSGHNFKLQVLTIFLGQGRLERKVHALLSEHRATNGRGHEWFTVTLQQALTAVALAITYCVHSGPPADLA